MFQAPGPSYMQKPDQAPASPLRKPTGMAITGHARAQALRQRRAMSQPNSGTPMGPVGESAPQPGNLFAGTRLGSMATPQAPQMSTPQVSQAPSAPAVDYTQRMIGVPIPGVNAPATPQAPQGGSVASPVRPQAPPLVKPPVPGAPPILQGPGAPQAPQLGAPAPVRPAQPLDAEAQRKAMLGIR